ncbi:MAG: hypothetical protein ABJF67_00455 [Aurantimonas coralicida]|uniref:hypothetical protein n=1 Tax=Aurantimonas sp. DM33-3 TaxID=2766955 RepID=UPI0016525BCE|nr:hypothetical protein [Aurantimonas sp. DM33-3]MBC6716434.1 hypothetical protein [Aurantimonas sp. DM33-3]
MRRIPLETFQGAGDGDLPAFDGSWKIRMMPVFQKVKFFIVWSKIDPIASRATAIIAAPA